MSDKFNIEVDEDGNLNFQLSPVELWFLLSAEQQEDMFLLNEGVIYDIVQKILANTVSNNISSPTYNSAIHKLRESLVASKDVIGNAAYMLIEELTRQLFTARTEATFFQKAHSKCYYYILDNDMLPPESTGEKTNYSLRPAREIKQELLDLITESMKEINPDEQLI